MVAVSWVLVCVCICELPPWGAGRPAALSSPRLEFCPLASIFLVCQLRTSRPTTLPHPIMARVSKLSVCGPAASKPRLRDTETAIWPGDAVVSQEVVASSPLLLLRLYFTNPELHLFSLSHFIRGLLYLLFLTHPALSLDHIRPFAFSSLIKVQSVFIHLSSRN